MSPHTGHGSGTPSGEHGSGACAEQRPDPRAAHLEDTLAEVVAILDEHDEQHWASRLKGVRAADTASLRLLLPGRGADDLHAVYLTTRHGHWLRHEEEVTANERLSLLRAILYMDARALLKDQ